VLIDHPIVAIPTGTRLRALRGIFAAQYGPRARPLPEPLKRSLSAEQRRALRVLAGNPLGCTEAIMLAHGFKSEMLGALVLDGLTTTQRGTVRAGRRQIKVVWVTITDAGRQALAGT
jgi:hypothetical protein